MTPSKPTPKKKAVKKSTAKPKTTKVSKPVPAPEVASDEVRTTTTDVVRDVFSTRPEQPETIEVPANSVKLYVNGNDKGIVDTSGKTLGEFGIEHAQRAGIRSFSIYADGAKAYANMASTSMQGITKVEIVAKDARA